jgi:G:T-mismatch repair DNA endonuclease (very short patch repair protein)
MEHIFEPNENFKFDNITLGQPNAIQGGAYFTKILYNNKSLYIQCPKCVSKQGIIKNGKKMYIELLFNHSDESIIQWFINLESTCQKRIFDKSNEWFQNPLELTDIESAFSSPIKVYKSCKYYLLRSNIKTNYLNGNPIIKIFNENEENVNVEDINAETNFISILEIQGIKFTTRNFQIEVEVKQIMTMNVDIIFENCLIKKHHHNSGLIQDVNEDTEDVGVTEVTDNIKKDIKNNYIVDLEEVPEIVFDDDDNTDDTSTNNISEDILNDIIENSKSNSNDTLGIVSVLSNTTNEANKSNSKDMFDNSINASIESTDELDELNEITLDIEELLPENTNTLEIPVIKLKKPNEVYYDLFNKAKSKAREAKKLAIQSYLEAKKIKETYLLEDVDLSEEEDEDNF